MDGPLSLHSIVGQSSEQISRTLDEECVVLNLKNSAYYSLNQVGAHVWNLLREPLSVDELRGLLLETYDVEAGRCERNLIDLLVEMRAEGLAEVRGALRSPETPEKDEPVTQEQKVLSKKPYSPPKLTAHGTVAELTKRVGNRGQLDGGSGRTPRTHV